MRIMQYIENLRLSQGGVARCVIDLVELLGRRGSHNVVVTSDRADAPEGWTETKSPALVALPGKPGVGGRLGGPALARVVDVLGEVDVAHLHGAWDVGTSQVARLCRRAGVPYIVSSHGMLDDWSMAQGGLKKRVFMRLFLRGTLRGAAATHCTAEAELAQVKSWIPKESQGVVVPLVFDLSLFETLPGPGLAREKWPEIAGGAGGEALLLFLSRLHYKKGVERLIDAVEVLGQRGVGVRAAIAGTGDEAYARALRERVRAKGLEERVLFLGFASGREKVSLFQAADLFVLPTSQENFGFVVFEALAAETPLVTTRGVDTWPELEASGGGTIVPVEPAPEELADAIALLLADPEGLAARGRAGRAWVMEHLDPERVAERFEAMYRSAIGAREAAHVAS